MYTIATLQAGTAGFHALEANAQPLQLPLHHIPSCAWCKVQRLLARMAWCQPYMPRCRVLRSAITALCCRLLSQGIMHPPPTPHPQHGRTLCITTIYRGVGTC